ncbi:ABC transporter substrate-binding protein [Burkholderia vietnamiensis]|uniref:ABC transporter substrate-binding protein n=1 Tax=Burkholderia vietnamiensis TaxID=60552 RepID=UPI00075BC201|nr:ABC transporter substrate-binding protein [Burkholderia vietnamiensis]KVF24200.1 sugar ABC transporter substrate-binding protein [Burkholderia vietnamiensis]KVF66396.1 sugar ABC transporter substrate-binding protein [Burkholderia vietnamiensis]
MFKKRIAIIAAGLLACHTLSAVAAGNQLEVMHWWTSGGEAKALTVLKDDLRQKGFTWKDSPIAGGGGEAARTVLRARVASNNPPDAMQMLGFSVQDYAQQGLLTPLDSIAAKDGWDKLISAPIQRFLKVDGHWYAVPVDVHSTNWIWANKKIFDQLKLTPPQSFDELVADADKIRKAGYIPLAHGGQPWQEATIFDSAVMSAGGPKFYMDALVNLDPKALGSPTMQKAFDQMRTLRGMVDPNFPGRDWNLATSMVINGKAAMQIMGDWAKGEFEAAGKKPGVDYLCMRYPGTQGDFIFETDQFATFKAGNDRLPGEYAFAQAVMDKSTQAKFSRIKGAIPARLDVPSDGFDACGVKSMSDMRAALKGGTMVGSFAHGLAMPEASKTAVYDVVTHFFNSNQSSGDAVKALVQAVANSK